MHGVSAGTTEPTATAGAAVGETTTGLTGRAARAAAVRELPVKASEEAWTPEELAEVRSELLTEVDRLTRQLDDATSSFTALVRSSAEGSGDDQVDHGATTAGREHEMTIVNNARDLLEQTQRALVRMSSGAYGVCESCSGAVGKARLQAFPRVTLCMPCKSRGERR